MISSSSIAAWPRRASFVLAALLASASTVKAITPAVTVPSNITVTATGPSGAAVTFGGATATDPLGFGFADGFESPAISTNGFEYPTGGSSAGPVTLGSWSYSYYAGVINGTNGAWGDLGAKAGSQYALLQEFTDQNTGVTQSGSIRSAQTVSLIAGLRYTLAFAQASRSTDNNAGRLDYAVSIVQSQGSTQLFSRQTAAGESWNNYSVTFTAANSGPASVLFSCVSKQDSDDTAFFDSVSLTTVGPVPVTLNATSGSTFPIGTTTVSGSITDVAGNTGTGSFTITVLPSAPVFTSTGTTLLAVKGTSFTQAFAATGAPAPTFTATGLPAGLAISSSGVISGTATVQGTYAVVVTATNSGGSASQTITLTVGVPFLSNTGLNAPSGVVTDSSGNLYVSNYNTNSVLKITPGGTVTTLATSPTVFGPTGLALDASGNLYVSNRNANNILKITPQDVVSTYISTGISGPWGVAFDPSGNLYVGCSGTSTVVKVPPGGGTSSTFATISGQPQGVACDSSGNVYTTNPGNFTISKISPAGVVSTFTPSGSTPGGGIACDSFGNVYFLNVGNSTVGEMTPAGVFSTVVTTTLSSPSGVALDSSGTLYVTNFGSTTLTHVAVEPAPAITSATTATGTYGSAFSYTIIATNSPLSYAATGLPSGLTLNSSTGAITGTPATAGTFPVQISATNAGTTGSTTLTLTINQAIPLVTWSAPAAILQGTALSATQLNASTPVAGTFAYSPAAGTVLASGAGQILRTTFTPTDTTDYASANASTTITVDAPTTVASVTGPASGAYDAGKALSFTVNYTAAVTVNTSGGTPSIAVTIGGVTRQATYVSGSGTTALVFKYIVQSGDTALNGISVTPSVTLNGGTIKDGHGFAATTSFTSPSVSGIDIDTVAPTLTWIDSSQIALNGNFQSYVKTNQNSGQYQTGNNLWYSGSIPGWTASGLHAVHAVDLTGHGDYAIQIWQDNVLDSTAFATGNVAGTDYEVSFVAGPTVQADSSQPTTAADGIYVKVLRANNSVLTSFTYLPGAWAGENLLVPVNFHYTGDGSGALHVEIGPSNFNSLHFGGAIDDLIVAPAAAFNPDTIVATATSQSGAAVSFLTSAYDELNGDIAVTASQASGTVFPLGSTPVTLSVQDTAGNTVSKSFTVQVAHAQGTIALTTPTSYVYSGAGQPATYTTSPAGLTVDLLYDNSSSTAPISAGSHTVEATLDPSQTWITAAPVDGTVAIAKADPSLSVTPYSVTYDSTGHSATGTATGVQGESLAGLDLSGTAHTNAGSYSDTWTFTDVTGNYNNASATVSDAIAQATATILVSGYAGTYDGAAHTGSGSATGAGGANLASLLSLSGAYTNVPGGSVSWSFRDPQGNYQPASGIAAVQIAPAAPVVSVTPYNVTYDGNAHTATGSAKGVLGEALSGLTLSGTTHTNAGTYSDSWSFTDGTGNYTNATGLTADKIAAAAATFTVTPVSFVYSGSAQGPTIAASPAGATFTVSGNGSATNAGSYSLTANATGNYTGTSGATAWKIVPGTVTLGWTQPAGITYGTPLSAAQLNATANVPGTFTYSPDVGAILSVGAGRTLQAKFTPADQVNYGSQTVTTTIDVAANPSVPVVTVPADQTVTATGPSGATATYSATATDALGLPIDNDGFESPATGNYVYEGGSVAGNWQFQGLAGLIHSGSGAWGGTASYEGSQYGFLQSAPAGQGSVTSTGNLSLVAGQSYTIWWAQASRTNIGGSLTYAVTIHGPTGDLQIYSRTTQNAEAWQYYAASFTAPSTGAATVTFSILSPPRVDDAIFLDAVSVTTTGSVPASTTPASGATFAPNTTTTVTASATNIAGTEGSGSFTVAVVPQQVNINFTTPVYTYDGTGKAASATTSPAGLPVTFSYNGGAGLPVNAGTYPVTATVDAGWAVGSAPGTLTIGQAMTTITVTPYAVTYSGAAHTATGTVTGVGGTDLSADLDLSGTTHTHAGVTTDTWTFTDPNGNYASATATVNDSIAQAAAVVSVTPYSVIYTGAAHTATGSVSGVLGEPLAGLNLAGTAHTGAGNYSDSWSFTDGTGNYLPAGGTTTDVIGKADPTVSVAPYNVTYDGAAHTASGSVKGVLNETLSGLVVSGTTHTNAGTYGADAWTFADATGNYNAASGTVSDSIAKANATVSVAPYSVTYDGAAHTATGTATGVQGESVAGLVLGGTTHTNAGTYGADAWTFADAAGNYNAASGTVSDSIAKANATVSVAPYSVTYDGNEHTATGSAKGVLGETLTGLQLSGTTHTNAGTYADTWSYTDATGNYADASGPAADSIAAAAATFTVTPVSFVYNGSAQGPTVTVSPTGATFTVTGSGSATNAGSYSLTANATGNYTGTSGATAWKIVPGTVTLNWAQPAGITYGTPLSATQLNATANVPGTFTYSPDLGAVLKVGAGATLNATFTPADSLNYGSAQSLTTTIDVAANPAVPVVTVPSDQSITATGPTGAVATFSASATDALGLTLFSDGFETTQIASNSYQSITGGPGLPPATFGNWVFSSTAGVINGPSAAWGSTAPEEGHQYIWLQSEGFTGPPVGQGSIESVQTIPVVAGQSYTVWWNQASRSNNGGALTYAVTINGPSGPAQIFSRSTQTAEGWQLYAASFTATTTGSATLEFSTISQPRVDDSIFLDDITVTTTGSIPVTTTPASGSIFPVGTTTVTASATDFAGAVGTQSFAVTVNPLSAQILFATPAYTYDGTGKAAVATTSPAGLPVTFTYNGSPTLPVSAGTYTVAASVNVGWAVGSAPGALTIGQATANISVTPYAVTYDGNAHTASVAATGVGSLDLSSDVDLTGTTHTHAGGTTDPWTFIDPNGNYASATGTVQDSIAPAKAMVSVTPYGVTYDGSAHSATGSASGIGGVALGGLNLTATAHTNAGSYSDAWTFSDGSGNYQAASGVAADAIAKANATISVIPYSVTYDGAAHAATGSAKGVLKEALSGLALDGTDHTNAGTYASDTWTFTDGTGNYNNTSGTVSDSIAKANATISVIPYSVTYDGAAHAATGSAKGVLKEALSGLALDGTGHTGAGTYASDGWTFTDTTGNYNNTSGTVSDSIAKANATLNVTPYNVTYDGQPHTAKGTATGVKSEDLSAQFVLGGTTHTNAKTYNGDAWSFTDTTGNYNSTGGTVNDSIGAATATVTVTGYKVTYDGNAHTATVAVAGINNLALPGGDVDVSKTTRTQAGTTSDPWTFSDASGNYAAASGTVSDTINKANATFSVTPYSVTYDGKAHLATGTATGVGAIGLSGLSLVATSHTAAGSFSDTWTFTDATGNYNNTSAVINDVISKAKATVVVTPYSVVYDGNAHTATGSATGVGGVVLQGLDLSGTTHTLPGSYADTWTFTDATGNYQPVTATTITDAIGVTGLIRQGITLSGNIDGSVQVLTGTADILNGNSMISGDLIVPGTPTVIQNGHITYAGTVDQTGSTSPSNYQIILNGNVVLRHVIRRVNAIAMPTVPTPPTPTGTVSVTINKSGQTAPNWATAKDVTLNGNVGSVTMPAGTYGNVVVNGNSTLVLGVAGATSPSVYNLQGLTVNGNGALQIVGPVVINSLNTFTANGNVGVQAHPDWLTVNVSAGGVTLNGNVTMYGSVVAPTANKGQVIINGNSDLYGSVTADSLIINGNGLLEETP